MSGAPRCPICRKPLLDDAAQQPRPFCSRRCKTADLGNWLDGRYVIADELPQQDVDPEDLSPEDLARLAELALLHTQDGRDG